MLSRRQGTSSETEYPRIYQTDRKTCLIVIMMFLFIFGFFVSVTIADATGMVKHRQPLGANLLADGAFLLLLAAGFYQRDLKVILYEDAIELKGWFSTRKLRRDEILGWRMVEGYHGISRYVITPTEGNGRKLVLPPFLNADEVFHSWMKNMPHAAH